MADYKHGGGLESDDFDDDDNELAPLEHKDDESDMSKDDDDQVIGRESSPSREGKEDVEMTNMRKEEEKKENKPRTLFGFKSKSKKSKAKKKRRASEKGNEDELEKEEATKIKEEREEIDDLADKEEKAKTQQKGRTFRFRISNIRLKLTGKKQGLSSIFMEFVIGGKREDVEINLAESKTVKKESKGGEKTEIAIPKKTTETRIFSKAADRWYTRLMPVEGSQSTDEIIIKFGDQEVEGLWHGSYPALANEYLTIRIWHIADSFRPNQWLGVHELNLADVAQSQIEREEIIFRWQESKLVREEAFAICNFKFELEEIFNFQIKFSKWKIELEDGDSLDSNSLGCSGFPANPPLVLGFHMDNTSKLCGSLAQICDSEVSQALTYHCIPYKDLRCCDLAPIAWCCDVCFCGWKCPWLSVDTHAFTTPDGGGLLYTSVPEYEKGSTSQTITYYGTRSALEDEHIQIYFWKGSACLNCCCCNLYPGCTQRLSNWMWSWTCFNCIHGPQIGSAKDVLQGKLDYGYLILYDVILDRKSFCPILWFCDPFEICNEFDEAKATNVKGVIETLNEPRYRQLGNVGKPSGGNKWFSFEKNTLYLAVNIIRAKGLQSLTEYKESLNPSVTVDWAQIRREIDMKEDNPDPFWNETVFFKVDCPEGALDSVNLDLNNFIKWVGSKVMINVWDSTGFSKAPLGYCEIDFKQIFNNRKPELIESSFGKSGLVSRYVYSTKQKLKSPVANHEAPDRHIELKLYFEMGNGKRVGPARKMKEKPRKNKKKRGNREHNKKLVRDEGVKPPKLKQARAFWLQALDSVPEFKKRTFAFCGIDEFSGGIYYLPTFLSVMVPPAEIKTLSSLLYYVTSIETVLRKTTDNYIQAKKRQDELDETAPGLRVWSDPWYFLDKRRGDHRDHAILLCNFLLGRQLDAYVCVGRARTKHGEEEHVWVMTREDPDSNDNNFPRTIRFWECSKGKTYVRLNRRLKQGKKQQLPAPNLTDGEYIEQNLKYQDAEDDFDEDDDAEEIDIHHSQHVSRIKAIRERKRFQYKLREDAKSRLVNDEKEEEVWLNKQERNHDNEEGQSDLPYTVIDVVFNNKNVYANLQTPDPGLISYDFTNEYGWRSFKGRYENKNKEGKLRDDGEKYFWQGQDSIIKPFYPDKTMVGTKAREQVVDIKERTMRHVVEDAIQSYREFKSEETKFLQKFPFQEQLQGEDDTAHVYLKKRLEEECKHGIPRDSNLIKKEIREYQLDNNEVVGVDANGEVNGYRDIERYKEIWLNEILESIPSAQKYEERMFFFKHADASRISDKVIGSIDRMLKVRSDRNPRFCVAAKIHRLPGYISPVRILVCIVHDK
mmetsp:Transcript_43208/g.70229  ORF Transcript_43208/g.70229 Transcript_43208/m.70229 type:complete len:1342 (+) Transcript_43208:86-4111(+)